MAFGPCATCEFVVSFEIDGEPFSQCRRRCPVPLTSSDGERVGAYWPLVNPENQDNGCGDHEPREATDAA